MIERDDIQSGEGRLGVEPKGSYFTKFRTVVLSVKYVSSAEQGPLCSQPGKYWFLGFAGAGQR